MKKLIAMLLTILIAAGMMHFGVLAENEQELPAEEPAVDRETAAAEATAESEAETQETSGEPEAEDEQDQEGAEPAPVFTGRLYAEIANQNEIALGDTVALRAVVSDANMEYTVAWESFEINGEKKVWVPVCDRAEFSFTATESTAGYYFRAHVVAEDGSELISVSFNVVPAAVAETPVEEPFESEEEPVVPDLPSLIETEEKQEPALPVEEEPTDAGEAIPMQIQQTEPELPTLIADEETAEIIKEADDAQTIILVNNGDESFEDINVREKPDGMSAIFSSLPEGTEVTIIEIQGDWVLVEVDGEQGYIFMADLAAWLELPESEEPETTTTEKKVTIFTSRRRVMEDGEPVYLTSKLEGFGECEEILYVWYVDKGNGFEEIPGANEATYTFAADAETLTWGWQLEVLFR